MHKVSMEKKLTRRAATRSGRMSTKKTITLMTKGGAL